MMDYFESEEFKSLLKSYEAAKQRGTLSYHDVDDYDDLAEYYIRQQMFEKALVAVEDGLSQHPDDMGLLGMRVSALINLNDIDEARKGLEELDPEENYDYYYLQAQLLLATNQDLAEANALFVKWLGMEIDDMKSDCNGKIDQQRLHENYLHIVASLSELNQENDDIQTLIVQWVDDFLAKCDRAGEYDTDLEIARVCHDEGMIDKEIELYNAFLDTNPYLDEGWIYLASLQHMNGQIDDAINSANFALAISPDDYYAVMLRAHSYFVSDRFAEALHDYLKYETLSGDVSNSHIIGRCYVLIGDRSNGYKRLEEAVAYTSSSKDSDAESLANTWAFIAQAFLDGGFMKEAKECVDKGLDLAPDSTEYILLKANIFLRMKDWDEAKYWFMKSLETTERKVMVELCIGGDYVYEERFDDAMEFFKMATHERKDPMRVRAYAYLAFLYFRIKDKRNFRRTLKIACENTPETICAFWEDELKGVKESDYYDRLKDLI